MVASPERPLTWIGSSKRNLRAMPVEVQRTMGYALYLAQIGQKHPQAKAMRGFGGAGVLEMVEDFSGNAFRVVYTVRLPDSVYVLHAFQKKSKRGIATPRPEIDLIQARLRDAEALARRRR